MRDNGQPDPVKIPVMPTEIVLHGFGWAFEPTDDGGMMMGIYTGTHVMTPTGPQFVPQPPGYKFPFDAEAWEKFRDQVADNGKMKPRIDIARIVPPPP